MRELNLLSSCLIVSSCFAFACSKSPEPSPKDMGGKMELDQSMADMPDQAVDEPDLGRQDMKGDMPDSGGDDMEASLVWEAVLAQGFEPTMQTVKPKRIELVLTPSRPAQPKTSWKVTSATVAGFDCSALISAQEGAALELVLPGDADARCADKLLVEVELLEGQLKAPFSVELEVRPSADRVLSFAQHANNPQPAIHVCPDWDCLNHADPTLGRLPSGELAVWFAAGGDRADGFPVVGRAVGSLEGGWVVDDDPVMLPTDATAANWDKGRETPSVRWNAQAGAWDMWYLGYNQDYFTDPAIGQARSMDAEGTQWARPSQPIYRPTAGGWDESFLTSPGALLGSDGVWRLYYVGASVNTDALGRVGVLTSTDGVSWTPRASFVFEGRAGKWDANVLDPHVQFLGGRYVMWYSALAGQYDMPDTPIHVGVAVSEDGYTWQRLQEEPIISPQAGTWTSSRVLDVEVLPQADGSLLMVGYAVSKEPPNPNFPTFLPGRIGFWSSPLPQ